MLNTRETYFDLMCGQSEMLLENSAFHQEARSIKANDQIRDRTNATSIYKVWNTTGLLVTDLNILT